MDYCQTDWLYSNKVRGALEKSALESSALCFFQAFQKAVSFQSSVSMRGCVMATQHRQSNIEATESETIASLLDPHCDIPPDIQFKLEDENGTTLGILGGHRALMALKSPVFKAMIFGPMSAGPRHHKEYFHGCIQNPHEAHL